MKLRNCFRTTALTVHTICSDMRLSDALKACIARQTRKYFPPKDLAKVYSHDLTLLLRYSGLEQAHEKQKLKNTTFELNWTIVKEWKEDRRYSVGISEQDAKAFHIAVVAKANGVLPRLQKYW